MYATVPPLVLLLEMRSGTNEENELPLFCGLPVLSVWIALCYALSETNRWFTNMIIYFFYFSVIPLSECWNCTADASTSQISEANLPLSLWPDL